MSVIVARALPDIRDGLKPVQRRTLYDMYELGIRYDRPYRSVPVSWGIPWVNIIRTRDSSIYEALVVMAQDFKRTAAGGRTRELWIDRRGTVRPPCVIRRRACRRSRRKFT